MASKLIIRFHPLESNYGQDAADWLIVNPDLSKVEVTQGLLKDIPKPLDDFFIIVLLPSTGLILTEIPIPRMKRAQLRKMAPFAIEDYLSTDLSNLHIAIGDFNIRDQLIVGGIQHEQMKAWLNRLKEANIQPDVFIPDLWYFPYEEQTWRVWIESNLAWVKTEENLGFVVDIANLKKLLELRCDELDQGGRRLPERIELIFQHSSALFQDFSELNRNNFKIKVDKVETSESFLEIINNHLPNKYNFNFLQPPYEVKKKWGTLKQQWFPVVMLLLVWVCLVFFKDLFLYFYLKHKNTILEQQAQANYQKIFASVEDIGIAKTRLQKLVEQSSRVMRGDPFLKKLNQVASKFQVNSIQLIALDYQNQILTLKVETKTLKALDKLLQVFKQKGISINKKNTMQKEDKIISQIIVK